VYTPIETGLDLVYPKLSAHARFEVALTGYVDDLTVRSREEYRRPMLERAIDVGQRVRMLPPWFGRAGADKGHFAELFAARAHTTSLVTDISTDERDTFYGDDWYRFLGNCKATIGQKGGASLCDPDGSLMRAIAEYQTLNPSARFEEIEAACFPGKDGQAVMKAISPRLFDAAMLHTVQILIEDDYLGVLEPWVHYIPTDYELSNFDEVEAALDDVALLDQIADRAAEVLIDSGQFSYKTFVAGVFAEIVDGHHRVPHGEFDLADELQWRLTPQLFEAVQRIAYRGWASGSMDQVVTSAKRVSELLHEHPFLARYLDADLLRYISGPIDLDLGRHMPDALVATMSRCFQLAALESVIRWLSELKVTSNDGWELLDWVDHPGLAMHNGARR